MKWFIITLLSLGIACRWGPVYAQEPCATPSPTEQQIRRYQEWVRTIKVTPTNKVATSLQYVPIRFHVIRRDDGSGGTDLATLNQAIVVLNQLYRQAGIAFYMCGSQPNFINSTQYFDMDVNEEDDLVASNYVSNAINVYLPNSIAYFGNVVGGYAYFPDPDPVTNRVFSLASRVTNTYTLAHELGHYFNLYHTFENNNSATISQRELVIRPGSPQNGRLFPPNCSTAGDLICDTPADPYGISGASISGCTYTGTIRDANNDLFTPSMTNIMSYYSLCVNTFTTEQYARMAEGLLLRLDAGNQYTLDCQEPGLATPANLAVTMTGQGALIQFTFSGNNASGFLIERSTSPTEGFVPITGLPPGTFSYTDASLAPYTTYYYRVKASNAANQYSNVQSVTSTLFYCVPIYSQPVANFVPEISDFIVQGTTLSNINTGNPNSMRYSDFSQTLHTVTAGQTYTFSARAVTGGFGTFINQHATIWLDVNRDGVLSSNEILFQSSAAQYMTPTLTGTITIPAGMAPGPARLRIRSQYNADGIVTEPCNTLRFGETEDYTLQVQGTVVCFTASSSVINASCFGGNNGQVTVTTQGATGPLSYTLNGTVNSTGVFPGLSAGQYTATIRDAGTNCTRTLTATVGQPTQLQASIASRTHLLCFGSSTGAITIAVSGATGPYSFTLSPGNSVQSASFGPVSFNGLSAANYSVAVRDANGCQTSVPVSITQPSAISASLLGSTAICGLQTVNLSATVSGGLSPYRLTIFNGSSSSQTNNYVSGTAIPVSPSQTLVYTLTSVLDANNCTINPNTSVGVTVNAIPNASISGNLTVCNGISNVLTASGGSSYVWNTGGTVPNLSVNTAGVYSVTAITTAGCRGVATATVVQCVGPSTFNFKAKFLLEGLLNTQTGQMNTTLFDNNMVPHQQPFNTSPWFYTGTEQANTFPANTSDWVLVVARANNGTIIDRKAGIVRKDGILVSTDGTEGIFFSSLPNNVYFSIHHKSHLAVMTNNPASNGQLVDFTTSLSTARGSQQVKLVGSWYTLYVGDYDASGVINNLDYNKWRANAAAVGQYLPVDADGNGVVNNLDYNRWIQNRSKVGTSEVQQ